MQNFDVDVPQDGIRLIGERVSQRALFLRKLYFLLALQFAFTNLFQYLALTYIKLHNWISVNHWGIAMAVIAQALLILVATYFYRSFFRRFPFNVTVYIFFTALLSYLAAFYTDGAVVPLLTTSFLILSLSLSTYALVNSSDFSFLGGSFYIITANLVNYAGWMILSDIPFVTLVAVTAASIIMGFYLIYDTKYLVIGQSLSSETEDPFVASIIIYVDFFLILFRIVENLGKIFKNIRY